MVQLLVDVMKIKAVDVDEMMSSDWSVPFEGSSGANSNCSNRNEKQTNNKNVTNATDLGNDWERIIKVDLIPESKITEEAGLLDLVNAIMKDVQDMAAVEWLSRQSIDLEERHQYLIKSSLEGMPSLSETFPLTTIKIKNEEAMVNNAFVLF